MRIDKNNPIKYNLKVTPKSTVYFQFKTKGSKNIIKINASIHIYYKDIFRIGKNYLIKSDIQSAYTSTIDTIHNIKMQIPEFIDCTQSFIYLWTESSFGIEIESMKTISDIEFATATMKQESHINRHKGQKVIKQQRPVPLKLTTVVSKPPVIQPVIPSVVSSKITFFVFVGEFGYEILSSHGWLRLLKSNHPNFKIGVASRGGVEFLYEDCCDAYVDITDILSKYVSECFGVNISDNDKKEIYKRCSNACKGHTIDIVYSNQTYHKNGIEYGIGNKGSCVLIRDYYHMQKQKFKLITLYKYKKDKEYILTKFPQLSRTRYVVLNDRRRDISWGRNEIDKNIWRTIIDRLIREGYLVVLLGYKPYKKDDAYSIFYTDDFKNIPGTVNISDFLYENINKNILYQTLIIQNAEFYLGIWGSAGYLPPLLGIDSYLLTLDRKEFSQIKKEAGLWNKFLSVGKGNIYCLDTTIEKESVMHALENILTTLKNNIENYVIEKYRKILMRKPQTEEFRHYLDEIISRRMTEQNFLEVLISSNEYKDITKKKHTNNFLSVLIRTHKRPKLLRRCIDLLNKQTKRNFVIILISDCLEDRVEDIISEYPNLPFVIKYVEPLGYPSCNIYFNKIKNIINSDYVVFVDDDIQIIDKSYFETLENICIKNKSPAVIMSRAHFKGKKIIPEEKYWNSPPCVYHVDSSNFCIRTDMYKKFDWPNVKCGDFYFIQNIFNNIDWKKGVYWHNKIVANVESAGFGKAENNHSCSYNSWEKDSKTNVCIVVPCRLIDEELFDTTLRFLNSIDKRTTYPHYEVLIYNNNSDTLLTERLARKIDSFDNKDKFKIINIENYQFNISQIYNWSLGDSRAELFIMTNNDMEIINKEWLANIIRWFNTRPDIGICIPFHDYIGNPLKLQSSNILKDHGDKPFAIYCIPRNIIEKIGGFDEKFELYCHDHDVYKTLTSKGYKILWAYNSIIKHYGKRTTIDHPQSEKYDLDKAYKLLYSKEYD